MAFKTEPFTGPVIPVKYDFQRYPLNMHRGEHPNNQTREAHSQEEEDAAIAAGWTTEAPKLPDPTPEFAAPQTSDERIALLQADVEELKDQFAELKTAFDGAMARRAPRLPKQPEAKPEEV